MSTRHPISVCKFCSKEITKQNVKRHEASCKENPAPDRSLYDGWRKTFNRNKLLHRPMGGANQTTAGLKKLSEVAKSNGLGGHTSKQKLYFKKRNGKIVFLQSSFEVRLAEILEKLAVDWTRPTPFVWVDDEGKQHRYYPDFNVGKLYLDTKNDFLAKKDARKIELVREQNNIDLRIILDDQINEEFIARIV